MLFLLQCWKLNVYSSMRRGKGKEVREGKGRKWVYFLSVAQENGKGKRQVRKGEQRSDFLKGRHITTLVYVLSPLSSLYFLLCFKHERKRKQCRRIKCEKMVYEMWKGWYEYRLLPSASFLSPCAGVLLVLLPTRARACGGWVQCWKVTKSQVSNK